MRGAISQHVREKLPKSLAFIDIGFDLDINFLLAGVLQALPNIVQILLLLLTFGL
jgi:hypothetical protein